MARQFEAAQRHEDEGTRATTYLLSRVGVCYDDDLARRTFRGYDPDTQMAVIDAAATIYRLKKRAG